MEESANTVVIPLSHAAPVRINAKVWPILARVEVKYDPSCSDPYNSFNGDLYTVILRKDECDGRYIVYGNRETKEGRIVSHAGFTLPDDGMDMIPETIRRVCGRFCGDDSNFGKDLGDQCLRSLPPRDL